MGGYTTGRKEIIEMGTGQVKIKLGLISGRGFLVLRGLLQIVPSSKDGEYCK